MATTNMNFGPEWMRGALSKHNGSSEFLDSLPFEQQSDNPFKYSKEFMLGLYKPTLQLPSDFQQHEYATSQEPIVPLAFEELTETEKKLLSGPVHSEASQRRGDKARHRSDLYGNSPLQSPANENGPAGNRLGGRKARTDYFARDQPLKQRNENDLFKRREQHDDSTLEGSAPWANKEATFGNGGLFNENKLEPMTFKSDSLFGQSSANRKPEEVKWFYRDPSGQVQGPFEAQEMQDWYKAGFFTPTLMLRRDDETVFEPLMVLTQKVGSEDKPFLMPRRASPPSHLFLRNDNNNSSNKYMPFSNNMPASPGGSIIDSFLGATNAPSTPLYQPYGGYGNSLLRDTRWNPADPQSPVTAAAASPSWLNSSTSDFFGNPASVTSPLASHFSHHQQPTINPMFGGAPSAGLFDYGRTNNDILEQQQYNYMMQQKQQQQQQQQQQQMSFQQTFSPSQQQQQQQQQQQPSTQVPESLQHSVLENVAQINTSSMIGSNHASPVMRSSVLSGWGSTPGTPIGTDAPASPWGSIVSTAIPTKVSEELQAKAPGAQSPRAPSSPKKAVEKPVKASPAPVSLPQPASPPSPNQPVTPAKTLVQSFAEIQLEEQQKAAKAQAAVAKAQAAETLAKAQNAEAKAQAETRIKEEKNARLAEEKAASKQTVPAPMVNKPVVSLREIQEEELRLANEKKAKQAKVAPMTTTTPSWAASNSTPLNSTSSSTWVQPAHKPLSLREIQEMEEKEASKKASAAAHLAKQEALANATPSTLSWGVVVPNNKSPVSPAASASQSTSMTSSAGANAAPWAAPSGPKKTLREIQQEEELAMKKKNAKATKSAAAAAAAAATTASSSAKTFAVSSTTPEDGWTTVTSVRVPKPTPPPAPVAAPAPSQPVQWTPVKKPVVPSKPSGPSEDFRRWCRKALRDLNSGVNQDEIIDMLISFPADANSAEIIEDVIYANSLRIDGKRFAQEFMKRRKADVAGRLDIVTAGLEEDDDDDFKVVQKKGRKNK